MFVEVTRLFTVVLLTAAGFMLGKDLAPNSAELSGIGGMLGCLVGYLCGGWHLGFSLVVWGSLVRTVWTWHATWFVNSATHLWGYRNYKTADDSRNLWWVALLTFGEGWHNNHYHFPGSARQGFVWWEYDLTYYGLWLLSQFGLVRDLKTVPASLRGARTVAK